jgi:hypothetical protein
MVMFIALFCDVDARAGATGECKDEVRRCGVDEVSDAVVPVEIDGAIAVAGGVDTEAGTAVCRQEIEHQAAGFIVAGSCDTERTGDVEAMDHGMGERSGSTASWRRPLGHGVAAEIIEELLVRKEDVAIGDGVGQPVEVEARSL